MLALLPVPPQGALSLSDPTGWPVQRRPTNGLGSNLGKMLMQPPKTQPSACWLDLVDAVYPQETSRHGLTATLPNYPGLWGWGLWSRLRAFPHQWRKLSPSSSVWLGCTALILQGWSGRIWWPIFKEDELGISWQSKALLRQSFSGSQLRAWVRGDGWLWSQVCSQWN